MHGTTRHGAQSLDPAKRREPSSYYNRQGPLGDVFRAFPPEQGRRIAIVGLGTGATAAYAGTGENWTFYEIDPDIAQVAQDTNRFTYLHDTRANVEIVLGDGRLSLGRAPNGYYSLIVLDAFSSDAIPTHLLTREALRTYQTKLTNDGVLVFHLSNRYLDLEPVLGRLSEAAGDAALIRTNTARTKELLESEGDPSIWAVVAPHNTSLGGLRRNIQWRPLRSRAGVDLWSDDFSNIFSVFRWPGQEVDPSIAPASPTS